MTYPKEGVDLEYKVDLAARHTADRRAPLGGANDAEPVEKTLWGPGQVDDVLSFP